jgi:hypothetical protein
MKKLVILSFMVFCMVGWLFSTSALSATYALKLEIVDKDGNPKAAGSDLALGEVVRVNINLDSNDLVAGADYVAGCAFTLIYPADILTAPTTTAEGVPTVASEITTSFPLSTTTVGPGENRVNATTEGVKSMILFSGAKINNTGGSGTHSWDVTIFSVQFTVKNDTTLAGKDVNFILTQTQLLNPDAGWGLNGQKENVPVLVGAVGKDDPKFGGTDLSDDFPVLLGDATHPFTEAKAYAKVAGGIVTPYETWKQVFITAGKADIGGETDDYDRDGYTNLEEMDNKTDPYVKQAATEFPADYTDTTDNRIVNLDIDNNGRVTAATDGALIGRYVGGKRGAALVQNIPFNIGGTSQRTDPTEIANYIAKMFTSNLLDVDDSGKPSLGTDGVMIKRYMAGKRGTGLIDGISSITDGSCNRCTAAEIEWWIKKLFPNN